MNNNDELEMDENNYRYYQITKKQNLLNQNYYRNNIEPKIDKLKNFRKLDKKNKCNSLDKINLDNTYSFKYDLVKNNDEEEDLDIELEAVSKKIPINNFYEYNYGKEDTNNYDSKLNYNILNNKKTNKPCSPLSRRKRAKIHRHASYDNLHSHNIMDDAKDDFIRNYNRVNYENRNTTNINIINNNINDDINENNENLNNKTAFDFYRGSNKTQIDNNLDNIEKKTIDVKINNIKIYQNLSDRINKGNYDIDDENLMTNITKFNYDKINYIENNNTNLTNINKENNNNEKYFINIENNNIKNNELKNLEQNNEINKNINNIFNQITIENNDNEKIIKKNSNSIQNLFQNNENEKEIKENVNQNIKIENKENDEYNEKNQNIQNNNNNNYFNNNIIYNQEDKISSIKDHDINISFNQENNNQIKTDIKPQNDINNGLIDKDMYNQLIQQIKKLREENTLLKSKNEKLSEKIVQNEKDQKRKKNNESSLLQKIKKLENQLNQKNNLILKLTNKKNNNIRRIRIISFYIKSKKNKDKKRSVSSSKKSNARSSNIRQPYMFKNLKINNEAELFIFSSNKENEENEEYEENYDEEKEEEEDEEKLDKNDIIQENNNQNLLNFDINELNDLKEQILERELMDEESKYILNQEKNNNNIENIKAIENEENEEIEGENFNMIKNITPNSDENKIISLKQNSINNYINNNTNNIINVINNPNDNGNNNINSTINYNKMFNNEKKNNNSMPVSNKKNSNSYYYGKKSIYEFFEKSNNKSESINDNQKIKGIQSKNNYNNNKNKYNQNYNLNFYKNNGYNNNFISLFKKNENKNNDNNTKNINNNSIINNSNNTNINKDDNNSINKKDKENNVISGDKKKQKTSLIMSVLNDNLLGNLNLNALNSRKTGLNPNDKNNFYSKK